MFAGAQRDALAEVTGDVLEGLEDVLPDVERIGDASKFVVDVNLKQNSRRQSSCPYDNKKKRTLVQLHKPS